MLHPDVLNWDHIHLDERGITFHTAFGVTPFNEGWNNPYYQLKPKELKFDFED